MSNKFNEKEFLSTVRELNKITPYLSSNPVAEEFIETIRLHCGFSEDDMYVYFQNCIDRYCPELKAKTLDVEGWKQIYRACMKDVEGVPYQLLSDTLKLFDKNETFQKYFDVVTNIFGIDKNIYIGAYLIHKFKWINWVDTLVRMADEVLAEETKKETIVSPSCEEMLPIEDEIGDMTEEEIETIEPADESSADVSRVPEIAPIEISDSFKSERKESKRADHVTDGSIKKKEKRGYKLPVGQYTLDGELVAVYESVRNAVRQIEESTRVRMNTSNIYTVLDKDGTSYGYKWKRIDSSMMDTIPADKLSAVPISSPVAKAERVKSRYVAYYLKGDELDVDRGPIGTFKSGAEIEATLKVKKSSVSKYLSPKYSYNRLKAIIDGEECYIGFKVESAA